MDFVPFLVAAMTPVELWSSVFQHVFGRALIMA
jgi:hypothetical protein